MKDNILEIKVLRDIAKDCTISQRKIAEKNGISLGKANYLIKALLEKGHIKFHNFSKSENKKRYAYLLTSAGLREKTRLSREFLKRKMEEYDRLQKEIKDLEEEVAGGK